MAAEETLTLLDNLLDAGILIERESRYDFSHALVASIVRNSFSLARRSFLHRRTAAALEAVHAGQVETVAGQLARHYAQAGRPPEAAHYAELAGQRALELTAPQGEIELYLGVEDRIKVERELKKREVEKSLVGGKRRVHFGYEIKLENLLPAAVSVTVHDQRPAAKHEDISSPSR